MSLQLDFSFLSGAPPVADPPTNSHIKTIIDKLVPYIAKNGSSFIDTVRINQQGNPDYSFLDSSDSCHGYYLRSLWEELQRQQAQEVSIVRMKQDHQSFDPTSVPVGDMPELIKESLSIYPPYTPLDPEGIKAIQPNLPEVDEYLQAKMTAFYADLDSYKPGMSYSDICEGFSMTSNCIAEAPMRGMAPTDDGSFKGGRAGPSSTGLGYGNPHDGTLDDFRQMKKYATYNK